MEPPDPDELPEPLDPDELLEPLDPDEPLVVAPAPPEDDPPVAEGAGVEAGVLLSPLDADSFFVSLFSCEDGVDVADCALRLSVM